MRYDKIGDEMFGYIKTAQRELRIREYEYYRASYCGLCRTMGKCTGQCSRMLLSYDFAFLANVRMMLTKTEPTFKKRRCIAHPFHPRMMMEPNEQLAYCADATAILAFEKCRDDLHDERGFARFKALWQWLFVRGAYKRAKKRHPALADTVRAHLVRLGEKEREQRPSVDEAAAIFADLLADVVSGELDAALLPVARTIGRQTGRFIYIVDAIDDLADDAKRKRFNPFLLLFGAMPNEEQRRGIEAALISGLSDMEAAFDLVLEENAPERCEILKNILYLGMPETARAVLWGDAKKCKEDSHEQKPL